MIQGNDFLLVVFFAKSLTNGHFYLFCCPLISLCWVVNFHLLNFTHFVGCFLSGLNGIESHQHMCHFLQRVKEAKAKYWFMSKKWHGA